MWSLHHAGLLSQWDDWQLPEVPEGVHPSIAAPPVGGVHLRRTVRVVDAPWRPHAHLGPERLAEDEVDERVQADVEDRHQDGQLLQVPEPPIPGADQRLHQGVGKANQVVGDKADAEDRDQNQHVSPGLSELLGVAGNRLILLCLRQPAGGAVVEPDEADEDGQEDGGGAGVDDLVEQSELNAVQDVTADRTGQILLRLLGEEGEDHVGAGHRQEETPRQDGDGVSSSGLVDEVISQRMDDLHVPAGKRAVIKEKPSKTDSSCGLGKN